MKQLHLNIILIVIQLTITVLLILNVNKKETPNVLPINYDLYKERFETLQNRIDTLALQVITFEQETDSIKIKIINNESKIDHASNNDVDSMFNALFTRHK